jgi:histidinol-phosphate aminotransferase
MNPLLITRRDWIKVAMSTAAGFALAPSTMLPETPPARPGGGTIRLSLNESPFGPSPIAVQAVRDQLSNLCRYTVQEADEIAGQIAAYEDVPVAHVLLGDVLEALGLHLGLQGPGGEFLYSVPGYTALVDAAKPAGGVGVPVPLDDRLENDLPTLQARINRQTRAVFVVNPHNPSGTVNDTAALRHFAGNVSQRTLVIVDEAYLEYLDDFRQRTLTDLVRAGCNVVVFRTFSKIYGLAGLPFGYVLAPVVLADALRKHGVGDPHSLNRLAVAAASASLRDACHVAGVRRQVAEERRKWLALLDDLHLHHSETVGSFIFFETGRPHDQIAAAFLKRGIDIGRAFPPFDKWTRITIGLPEENARVQQALRSILT